MNNLLVYLIMTTELDINKTVDGVKTLKTKDYILRARRNYERKRYLEDPEFRKKKIEYSNEHKKKNIEKTREYKRNYMREYRAKKKAEKNAITEDFQETPNDLTDAVDALSISKD
jgi:hypothetical protein